MAARWFLIVVFSLFHRAHAHAVVTVLFFIGICVTGVGFVLAWELPAWLITVMDGTEVWLLWTTKARARDPGRDLVTILAAPGIVVSRAAWIIFVPAAALVLVLDAAGGFSKRGSSANPTV